MSDNNPRPLEPATAGQTATPAPRRARRPLRFLLLIAGPLLVIAIGGHFYLRAGLTATTDNAYVKADSVAVSPAVAGIIERVRVTENQLVQSGDVLFEIDDDSFVLARDQAASQLEAVRTYVEGLRASYAQVLEEIELAQTEIHYAEIDLTREQELADRGLGTRSKLDEAQHELDSARQQIPILDQRLAQLQAQLGGADHPAIDAHPAFRMVQAMLESAELDLSRTVVRAPIDGIVSQVPLPGAYAAPGAPVLAIVSGSNVWIEANFKETQLTHMRVGQAAAVRLDTYPDDELSGVVDSISPATGAEFSVIPAQNASGNWVKVAQRIPVRIRLDRDTPLRGLRAGMSATVTIDTAAESRGDTAGALSAEPVTRENLASRSDVAPQ